MHEDLKSGNYRHGHYYSFYVNDPKRRHIHKAIVRDRIVHHVIVRALYPVFDRLFIFDSYSCRIGKGTHKAIDRFQKQAWKLSRNNTRTVYVLKCDIEKFFEYVDHSLLLDFISRNINDPGILGLVKKVIGSFHKIPGRGLPLGNITSQLFANIYLNELDKFVKRELRITGYYRYGDDFIVLSNDLDYLLGILAQIRKFLSENLKLKLHPQKVKILTYRKGVDFLGYIQFPNFRLLRNKTRRRILNKLKGKANDPKFKDTLASYMGVAKHCRNHRLKRQIIFSAFSRRF